MARLDITALDSLKYRVIVSEEGSTSTHEVTLQPEDLESLSADASGEKLVEASFRFLLDREPKESIMSRFDLSVISRYFPDFPDRIADYL
ncbi:MAG TPA: hypothetical protein VF115_03850 [Acidimicrobiia bacterium]